MRLKISTLCTVKVLTLCLAMTPLAVSAVQDYHALQQSAQPGPRLPAASSVSSRLLPQPDRTGHLRGELILKFKEEAVVGAVATELVRGGQPFQEVTGDDGLDQLNRRYKVRAMHKAVTKPAAENKNSDRIDRKKAEALHRQERDRHRANVATVWQKRLKKKGLAANAAPLPKDVPNLASTYRVELDPETDIVEACRAYGRDPHIASCQPNLVRQVQWTPNDPYYSSFSSWGQGYDDLWGLKKLETTSAWDITRGAGVVVAVVDTGVDYNHVDLAANIWTNPGEIPGNSIDDDGNGFIDDVRGWNFSAENNNPYDGHGHGTHVSGTIAAIGDNAVGIVGVAPLAKIMPVKGLSDEGGGTSFGLIQAIKYAVDNGADVINNSWGCSSACPSDPEAEEGVKYAHDLGAVVVFAAGNSTADVAQYSPTNQSDYVIAVAASSELDTRSYFSNYGSLVAVAAPGGGEDGASISSNRIGRNILSLRAGSTDMSGDGISPVASVYYRARGTSMATPHVSGVAALVVAQHPEFTPDDVSLVLRATADDVESPGFDVSTGAGRVNARKALAISSVPQVRITSLPYSVDVTKPSTVTIRGDAYGAGFASYRLWYAPLTGTPQAPYIPTTGIWQPLGPESAESVVDGVLATLDNSLFQPGQYYLVKLEVVTTDNVRFSSIKKMAVYADNGRFYRISGSERPIGIPTSVGDRFAWINSERLPDMTEVYPVVVFDGATNKVVTIYPEAGETNESVFLSKEKIVWGKTKTFVGAINSAGDFTLEYTIPYAPASIDQDVVLLLDGSAVRLLDLTSGIVSSPFPMPDGERTWESSLLGNSVASARKYPALGNPYDKIYLSNLTTGNHEAIRVIDTPMDYGQPRVYETYNVPGFVVWIEHSGTSPDYFHNLKLYDKTSKQVTHISNEPFMWSFASDGKNVLYARYGSDTGERRLNLYSYDIQTGATNLFATNFEQNGREFLPSYGTRHVQWWREQNIMIANDVPLMGGIGHQAVAVNTLLSVPPCVRIVVASL